MQMRPAELPDREAGIKAWLGVSLRQQYADVVREALPDCLLLLLPAQ